MKQELAGLDVSKFKMCLSSTAVKASVEKDMEEGKTRGINGTPTFFINGEELGGAQPFEMFSEVIERKLK